MQRTAVVALCGMVIFKMTAKRPEPIAVTWVDGRNVTKGSRAHPRSPARSSTSDCPEGHAFRIRDCVGRAA